MRFISIFTHEPTNRLPTEAEMASMGQLIEDMFAETNEVLGGYALLEAASKEEVVAHTRRFLDVVGQGTCEIYQLHEMPTREREYPCVTRFSEGSTSQVPNPGRRL